MPDIAERFMQAYKEDNIELAGYYKKEINAKKRDKEEKEGMLR